MASPLLKLALVKSEVLGRRFMTSLSTILDLRNQIVLTALLNSPGMSTRNAGTVACTCSGRFSQAVNAAAVDASRLASHASLVVLTRGLSRRKHRLLRAVFDASQLPGEVKDHLCRSLLCAARASSVIFHPCNCATHTAQMGFTVIVPPTSPKLRC